MEQSSRVLPLHDWHRIFVSGKPVMALVEAPQAKREGLKLGYIENETFVATKVLTWEPGHLHHTQAVEFSETVGDIVYRYLLRVLGAQESLFEPPEC